MYVCTSVFERLLIVCIVSECYAISALVALTACAAYRGGVDGVIGVVESGRRHLRQGHSLKQ